MPEPTGKSSVLLACTVSEPPEESSVVLASKENIDIGCHSDVFAGAHFSGATTINVQINQQQYKMFLLL